MVNYRIVLRILGFITFLVGVFMLIPSLISIISGGDDGFCFMKASFIAIAAGGLMALIKPKNNTIKKREGYLIVGFGWIMMCIFGALPYIFHHDISFENAIFESASGFTTTGASIFTDIESLCTGTLFWRSLTQWIGGMGIIVFTVAIFPLLGIGGVELFVAESPGPQTDKIHPRIKEVAKRLWLIYVSLTFVLCLILHFLGGMTFFDAINHAMTTMSTGGFSTKNASLGHFDSLWVQYPVILFMFIGGMNYTIIYQLFKGRFRRAWRSDEFKFYLLFTIIMIFVISMTIYGNHDVPFEKAFRDGTFQLISVITTTGFITADYTQWHISLTLLFFLLLFLGACAGSTSGGIKIIRHLIFMKNSYLEFKRLLNPRAYVRVKMDDNIVSGKIITHILVFLLCYMILFVVGSLFVINTIPDDNTPILTSIGAVATCLGNVGPGIGSVGPVDNFAHLPGITKLFLSFYMVVGRLEVFTILIIFTPFFWKNN